MSNQNCKQRPILFPPDGLIGVGLGYIGLCRDGKPVWTEMGMEEGETRLMTREMAEKFASADPNHDWRIVLNSSFSRHVYQRNVAGQWVLIEQEDWFLL